MKYELTSNEAQLIVDVLREFATLEREALAKKVLKQSHHGDADELAVSFREFLARARAQT